MESQLWDRSCFTLSRSAVGGSYFTLSTSCWSVAVLKSREIVVTSSHLHPTLLPTYSFPVPVILWVKCHPVVLCRAEITIRYSSWMHRINYQTVVVNYIEQKLPCGRWIPVLGINYHPVVIYRGEITIRYVVVYRGEISNGIPGDKLPFGRGIPDINYHLVVEHRG